jgi:hypothetical protein
MGSETPAPAMIIKGEPWWHFSYEYDFEGSTYAFDVCARSEAEAHARMKKIALARYLGQLDGNPIPAWRGGLLVPLIVWWRNFRASR